MTRKTFELGQFKMLDDSPNGGFSGYGSVYGNYDRVNEAVAEGAFKNLDEFVTHGFIAIGHDWSALPVATIAEVKSDSHGLWIRVEFHSTAKAQEARQTLKERLERGKFVGLSIGYETRDYEPTDKGRVLTALELFEVSIVNTPANPLAGVTGAKGQSLADMTLDDHTEQVLATARTFITRLKALHELRAKDARTISAARRDDLAELKAVIEELCALTTPKAPAEKANAAYARFLAAQQPTPERGKHYD